MRLLALVMASAVGAAANSAGAQPVTVRHAPGTLHGFPSMSDGAGKIIADGELTQVLAGDRLTVTARWVFGDGLRAEEHDVFRVGRDLVQERFSWVETKGGEELRRFEVDLTTGEASAVIRGGKGGEKREEARLELPRGRAFAGYGIALAAIELPLEAGAHAEITVVAFTPKPRAVTLEVRHDGEERIPVAGRSILCDRYKLHPKIPFPVNLFAGAKDAHLWLTHTAPPGLVRAVQNLVTKDDPLVVIDVTPRGPTLAATERQP